MLTFGWYRQLWREVVVHIGRGQDLRLQSPPEVLPAYHYSGKTMLSNE